MSPGTALVLFSAALLTEGYALHRGQRRLFWAVQHRTNSRWVAYLLAAPGTALHEAAHYIVCLLLGVPAGDQVTGADGKRGRVSFFFPRTEEDGSVTLGSVPHAQTDPLRGALIACAPVYLVPPLFLGLTAALFGTDILHHPWQAYWAGPWWAQLLWVYLAFSCGQAAFPSPGDHIGFLGAVALAVLGAAVLVAIYSSGGTDSLARAAGIAAAVLAVPAIASALGLLALEGTLIDRRRTLSD